MPAQLTSNLAATTVRTMPIHISPAFHCGPCQFTARRHCITQQFVSRPSAQIMAFHTRTPLAAKTDHSKSCQTISRRPVKSGQFIPEHSSPSRHFTSFHPNSHLGCTPRRNSSSLAARAIQIESHHPSRPLQRTAPHSNSLLVIRYSYRPSPSLRSPPYPCTPPYSITAPKSS